MTEKQLSQLFYLTNEIKEDERRLKEIRETALKITPPYQQTIKGKGKTSDNVGNAVLKMIELEMLIQTKKQRAVLEKITIQEYINSVDDSLMRQIIAYRFIDCMTWQKIANKFNETDESYYRRKFHKFLKDN